MIKRIGLLVAAALMVATMMVATAAPAFAASRSERECIASGGEVVGSGGNVDCFDRAGQSDNGWSSDLKGGSGKLEECRNPGDQTSQNERKCAGR